MTIDLLVNHGIPTGWTDALPWLNLTNQQPHGFHTHISVPGEELDSADSYTGPDDAPVVTTATVVPECVHIHMSQLPADEQPGAENALILEGEWVYKVFAGGGAFSKDIYAWVRVPADGALDINVPVQVHYNPKPGGDGSPGAAVWRLWVDGRKSEWFTFVDGFVDRKWDGDDHWLVVTAGQIVTIRLQLESRSEAGIDFFTDLEAWRADFTPDDPDPIPEPETCEGWTIGREQYERTYILMPPDCDDQWPMAAMAATWNDQRFTVGGSADDAGIGPEVRHVIAINDTLWHADGLGWWYEMHYPGVGYVALYADSPSDLEDVLTDYIHGGVTPPPEPEPEPPDPEPLPPDPEWKAKSFVPFGIKLGWHAIGNCGLANMPKPPDDKHPEPWIDYGIYGPDMRAPTIKLVTAISDIQHMPCLYPMVRLVDATVDGVSVNYQNFDYNGDPFAQAEARVADLVRVLSPYAGQFRWTELCNEQDIPDLEHAVMIARYSKRAMEVAPAWLGFLHFSFGTGNPELGYWKPIADTGVFEQIAERGDGCAFHSYHDHRVQADMVWHLTRYRFLYDEYILPRQLDIPMVLTECGPWRHLFYDSTFSVAEWVIVTDQWLSQDPYAMAQIYTVSDVGGETEYSDAFKALYPWFIEYARSVKDRVNG